MNQTHSLSCRKKEKYLDIYTKVIPASRESGVLDNLDIGTTPLACPPQGYLKACQGASIMISRPYKVFSSYYLVSQRISRYLPCHGRLGFPTICLDLSCKRVLVTIMIVFWIFILTPSRDIHLLPRISGSMIAHLTAPTARVLALLRKRPKAVLVSRPFCHSCFDF